MLKSLFSRQFVLFLVTGGIAALVNFFSRVFYDTYVSFSTAIVLAYLTGMVTAFLLARTFVFTDSKTSMKQSIAGFLLVNAVAIAQTWIISIALANHFLPFIGLKVFVNEVAHGVGVLVPVFTSFFGHKLLSFRS